MISQKTDNLPNKNATPSELPNQSQNENSLTGPPP